MFGCNFLVIETVKGDFWTYRRHSVPFSGYNMLILNSFTHVIGREQTYDGLADRGMRAQTHLFTYLFVVIDL